jgi:hypothetical protein
MGMKKETDDTGLGRRKFLKFGLGFMAGIGVLTAVGGVGKAISKKEKIKMLTPDGKLVEIDASHIEKVVSDKASNEDLQQWMKTNTK